MTRQLLKDKIRGILNPYNLSFHRNSNNFYVIFRRNLYQKCQGRTKAQNLDDFIKVLKSANIEAVNEWFNAREEDLITGHQYYFNNKNIALGDIYCEVL